MWVLLAIAAAVAFGSVWLSYRPLRKLLLSEGRRLRALEPLRAGLSEQVLRGRLARLPDDSELRSSVCAVMDAADAGDALFAVTEISLLAQAEVRRVGYVPRVAARIALAAGTLIALVILSQTIPAGRAALPEAAVAFGMGALGGIVCAGLGRKLDLLIEERRGAWTKLLDLLGTFAENTHLPTAVTQEPHRAVDPGGEAD